MERNYQFSFKPTNQQFNDITNYKTSNSNADKQKVNLRSSIINDKSYQMTLRRSKSKDKEIVKGLNAYNKLSDSLYSSRYQPTNYQKSSLNVSYDAYNKTKQIPKRDTLTHKTADFNSFFKSTVVDSNHTKSMKVSRQFTVNDLSQIRKNTERESRFNPITNLIGIQKEKFNFRESLGSLSKQIKNTLKSSITNNNIQRQNLTSKNVQKLKVQTQNTDLYKSVGNGYTGTDDQGQTYKRYETSSSFLLNSQISRCTRQKKPLNLEFKFQKLQKSFKVQDKQNITKFNIDSRIKNQRSKTYLDNNFLRQSAVTPLIKPLQGMSKHNSMLQPSTPQLRKDKKIDTYNMQRQKKGYSTYETPTRYDYCLDIKTSSQFRESKNSLLHSAVLDKSISTNKFPKQRDSLSSKGRQSLDNKQLCISDFHLGSIKGEGRFGKFYPAIHKKTGMLVGIKQIKKQSLKHMLDQFIQQLKIQSYIDHPNIVKLYGYFCTKQNFYIILEYMQQGSLFSFIKKSKKIQEEQTSAKLKQICSAVQYLHENEILHRDIKPQNIVLTCDVCKLCDFGWAVYTSTRRKTYCGTLDYVCPQILEGDSYDSCVDIWAIGVLAFEMAVGKAPFYNISRKQTMKKIMECNFQLPKQLSPSIKDFISKALNKNAQQRSSIAVLAKHDFIK